jgi:hypothetical protein
MQQTFHMMGVAKSSTNPKAKAEYVEHVRTKVMPNLKSELAIYQAIAMLLGYIPLELGTEIPCRPTVCETDADGSWGPLPSAYKVVGVFTQQISEESFENFKRMGLEWHPSVKVTIWKGRNIKGEDHFIVSFTGTTSYPQMDASWKEDDVTTGALGNADPKGISRQGFEAVRDPIVQLLRENGWKLDSKTTVTGHSQGGALALRFYTLAHSLGRDQTKCVAFSAPGLDEETFSVLALHAGLGKSAKNVYMIEDPKDKVPWGGEETPFGTKVAVPYRTARFGQHGIIPSKFDDLLLGHGTPNLVWLMIYGGPYYPSDKIVEYNRNTAWKAMDFLRHYNWLSKTVMSRIAFKASKKELKFAARAEKDKDKTE